MSENCTAIIDSLIQQRKQKGMTQSQLAQAAELTQAAVARMESKKAVPQLNTLIKVVHALDCSLEVIPKKGENRDE